MSKVLATIYTNVELPFEIDQVSFEGYKESVNDFYKKYEMRSLMTTTTQASKSAWLIKNVTSIDIDEEDLLLMPVCTKESFSIQKLYGFMIPYKEEILYLRVEDALEDAGFKNFCGERICTHGMLKKQIIY